MSNVLHFAKVFGICWTTTMVVYLFVVYRWGFSFSLAFSRMSHPPIWAIQMMFWLWPVIPAFIIAGLWEMLRVIKLHIVR